MRGQGFDFLAAAAEHEGIAALEPQHPLALLREFDEERADLLLRQFMIVRLLADVDAFGLPPHEAHQGFVGEPVVEHDIGLLHQAKRAESKEVGIARTRADQIDLAARRLDRLGSGALDRAGERGLRAGVVASEHPFSDRSLQNVLPEAAAQDRRGNRLRDGGAKGAGQAGETPISGGDQAFQPRLQHARQDRRSALSRDRNDERIAVDDRGHDEVAEARPVGDIDQGARLFRRGAEDGRETLVLDRDEAKRRPLEIPRLGIAGFMPKIRQLARRAKILAKLGCKGSDARAGLHQEFGPTRRDHAAADNDGGLVAKVEKNRQVAHG